MPTVQHCSYCLRPIRGRDFTLDHVVPVTQGGSDQPDNLTPCCRRCNSEKGGRTIVEWFAQRAAAAA